MYRSSEGFTFSEILIVVAIMGIVTSVALKNMGKTEDRSHYEESLGEIQKLKRAIIGNENALRNGERTSFGFIGDIGTLPSSLDNLLSRGSLGNSRLDTTFLIAYGWAGPYIDTPFTGDLTDFKTDGWGNAYVYSTTQYAVAPGDTVVAKISSLGADGTVGGTGFDADIFVEIKKSLVESNITGCVLETTGLPVVSATIRVYEPDGAGGLTSRSDNTDISGCYTINAVSQGIRAITLQPAAGTETEGFRAVLGRSIVSIADITISGGFILVGIPVEDGANGEDLLFTIQNKVGELLSIIDFEVVYTPFDGVTGPTYDEMRIGGALNWSAAATRAGSGDRLSSLNTFTLSEINTDELKEIRLENFKDNLGVDVNIFGTEFTASFFASDDEEYIIGPFLQEALQRFCLWMCLAI